MSLTYGFSFPPAATGLTCVVTNETGTEVASEAVPSEIGEDGSVTLQVELDEGDYTGTVQPVPNTLTGVWTTNGVLNLPASIAAGGGVILDGAHYDLEVNNGQDFEPEGGGLVAFDTIADGLTIDGNVVSGIPTGLYTVDWNLDFDQPAERRALMVTTNALGSALQGPKYLDPLGASGTASVAYDRAVVVVDDGTFSMYIAPTVCDPEATPADLAMSYGFVRLTKIG